MLRGGISWINSAMLIGDDELGGASRRVHCIGACPVLASKQWMPEDGSKIEKWLAQRNHEMLCRISLPDSAKLHQWRLVAGSSARTAAERTSLSKRYHRRGLTSRSTWATADHGPFNKLGGGPRIFHRLARNWPGLPEIARPCWQRKSAQGGPLEKERRCEAHCVRVWVQARRGI